MDSTEIPPPKRFAESELLRTFADHIPHLIWSTDARGALLWINRSWRRYAGISEGADAPDLSSLIHPDYRPDACRVWQECLRSGEEFRTDYPLLRNDGAYCWFRTTLSRQISSPGEEAHWIGTSSNIDELRTARADLRSSKERLSAALIASGTGTFRWDIQTNALEWDEPLDRLFGISTNASARSLDQFMALVHPDDRQGVVERCDRCRKEGADFEMEFRVIHPDGSIHWLLDQGKTFFGGDGKPSYMTGACVDISARRQIDAMVQETRSRMDLVIEASQVGVWFCDLPFDTLVWDAKVKEHFWLSPEAVVTIETFYQQIHPDDRARTQAAIEKSIEKHERYDIEYRTCSPKGEVRWVRAIGRGFYNAQGEPWRFDGVTLDITDAVLARMTSEERREELQRMVSERTVKLQETIIELEAFSYNISHDLRAPLRAMQGFSKILEEECGETISDEGKDYIRRIVTASHRMDRLIQDVLNYSRISQVELPLTSIDAGRLISGILETYPQFATSVAKIELQGEFPCVRANEAALTQCVSNLLGNAIKFVEPGRRPVVRIWAEVETQTAKIYFADNGVGIPSEFYEKIFAVFTQLNQDYEGTGIGLSIVRKAVERMGGVVGVQSEVGKGSVFFLKLALA